MALLTLLILLCFIIVSYYSGRGNLLSPWFLLCLALTASFSIILLNSANWNVAINPMFILYVVTAIVFFGFGCMVAGSLVPVKNKALYGVSPERAGLTKKYPANLFLILSALLAVLYVAKLLSDVGGGGSLAEKIRNIYDSIVQKNYTPGFFFTQMLGVIVAIAYLNTFRLLQKFYSKKDSVSTVKLIIPIAVFIITVVFTSDRNIFLRYAIFAVAAYMLFYRENSKKSHPNRAILVRVAVIAVAVLVLFYLFGKIKMYKSDFFRSLGIYGGSGLYNFNLWIADFDGNMMMGNSTFSTFLNSFGEIFGRLGFKNGFTSADRFDSFIEFVSPNGYVYSSNIYSALKPYVEDFGYLGAIIFPFILGVFFQILFNNTKKGKYGYFWILYCMLLYPVIFFPVAEQLFRRFSLSFIYELFWMTVVYVGVYGKKRVTCRTVARSES